MENEIISRLHNLMKETAEQAMAEIEILTKERSLAHPSTDRDKLMYHSGIASLAYFVMGATLDGLTPVEGEVEAL